MSDGQTADEQRLSDARGRAAALIRGSPAAATALRAAALLPPDAVPWLWLHELTTARHPETAANPLFWGELRGRLETLGLLTLGPAPEVARIHPRVAADLAGAIPEREAAELRAGIRDLVSVRLREFTAERRRLFGEVLRGNAGPEAAGWYVAPLSEVQARADAFGSVEVWPQGEGSFVLSLKKGAFWEEPCFTAFVGQQFAGDDPDAIEWALRTGQLSGDELENARDRMQTLHARRPDGLPEGRVMGLYLLDLARTFCTKGYDRSAWNRAGEAVKLFEQLHERHPADPDIAALLEEARQAQWRYDW
jgi:hypothetical protein